MRLTNYSDYAMRVLFYLAVRTDRLSSIAEIAKAYGISQNHLMKVVQDLAKAGFVTTTRGRGGGIKLGMPAEQIRVGAVLRHTEDSFDLVDCPNCAIARACGLTGALNEAMGAFMAVLDDYTLADVMGRRRQMLWLFNTNSVEDGSPAAERSN